MRKIKYVFLSYSSENTGDAEALKALMENSGISVWMASHEISFGENFADIIPPVIEKCACFVLLLTEEAQRSSWVPKELDQAIHLNKPIIPVQLTNVPLSNAFKFSLINCQILTLTQLSSNDPHTQKFLSAVKAGLAGKKPPVLHRTASKKTSAPRFPKAALLVLLVPIVFLLIAGFIIKSFSGGNALGDLWDQFGGPEQPAADAIDQIPDKYANEVLIVEHSTSSLDKVSVKVGEYTTTQSSSVWPDCIIYSKDTRIAIGEGPLVKGVAPGETVVVVVSQTGSATAYRVIVTE